MCFSWHHMYSLNYSTQVYEENNQILSSFESFDMEKYAPKVLILVCFYKNFNNIEHRLNDKIWVYDVCVNSMTQAWGGFHFVTIRRWLYILFQLLLTNICLYRITTSCKLLKHTNLSISLFTESDMNTDTKVAVRITLSSLCVPLKYSTVSEEALHSSWSCNRPTPVNTRICNFFLFLLFSA